MTDERQIFIGSNDTNASDLFEERKRYQKLAYPKDHPFPIDLWHEQRLYGKTNKRGAPVIIDEENLQPLAANKEAQVFAVDFVSDAFEELREYVSIAAATRKIKSSSPYYKLVPKMGWQNIDTLYYNHMKSMYEIFVAEFLIAGKKGDKVEKFEDFMDEFSKFVDLNAQVFYMTLSSFTLSNASPPHISGLVIDLDKEDEGDDLTKSEKYIKDDNFEFFRKAAYKHGFLIDKNAPWRLVANLGSKYMQRYAVDYGLPESRGSSSLIMDQYYVKASERDLDTLKTYMVGFYNSYVAAYPHRKKVLVEGDGLTSEIIKRQPVTDTALNDDKYWIEFYSYLRLKEAGYKNKKVIDRYIHEIFSIYKTVDFNKALWYIDTITR